MTPVLRWLGQSGFVFDGAEELIGVDLYLSDHLAVKYRGTDKPHDRLHPCPATAAELSGLRWIFATHKHSDHLDPGSISELMQCAPEATLVLPRPLLDYAARELKVPAARMQGIGPGERVGPFLAVPARHPGETPDVLSVLVHLPGMSVFHSGDTLAFDGQRELLRQLRPDVVLVPANGRVAAHLGTPPNMTLEEGIELAKSCGARLLIPHHYDMFAFNSRPIVEVRDVLAASGVPHLIPGHGQPVDLWQALAGHLELS